jgi:hypothetical protein
MVHSADILGHQVAVSRPMQPSYSGSRDEERVHAEMLQIRDEMAPYAEEDRKAGVGAWTGEEIAAVDSGSVGAIPVLSPDDLDWPGSAVPVDTVANVGLA